MSFVFGSERRSSLLLLLLTAALVDSEETARSSKETKTSYTPEEVGLIAFTADKSCLFLSDTSDLLLTGSGFFKPQPPDICRVKIFQFRIVKRIMFLF